MLETGVYPPHEPDGDGFDAVHEKLVDPLVPSVCCDGEIVPLAV
jgi:hypothetical protein